MICLSYGGGTDSTGLALAAYERGLLPAAEPARRAGVTPATVAKMQARMEGRPWRSL